MVTTFSNVHEKSTRVYTATIEDENGNAIPSSSLTTLLLTLYSQHSGTIINSREGQNVLNANNVTVDANGLLTWTMQPDDNQILDNTLTSERHKALFEFTYSAGAKSGKHEVVFVVDNLSKVT